jgi:hypothetical protein
MAFEYHSPLTRIASASAYVVFSDQEGLLLETETPRQALDALAEHLITTPLSVAHIFKRTETHWELML